MGTGYFLWSANEVADICVTVERVQDQVDSQVNGPIMMMVDVGDVGRRMMTVNMTAAGWTGVGSNSCIPIFSKGSRQDWIHQNSRLHQGILIIFGIH